MDCFEFDPLSFIISAGIVFIASIVTYRLYLHDLQDFPGPRLAACTSLYKTYYEVLKGGELLQRLVELHEKYGPVVRIGPNELHFNEYPAYADIYSIGSGFIKHRAFYKCFGADGSTFGTINPQDSKRRRNILSPLFSRSAILNFEGVIQTKVEKLIARLGEYHQRKPVNMFLAFRCATMDIITLYCFAHCVDSLDAQDFYDPLLVTIQNTVPFFWVMKLLPFLVPTISVLPEFIAMRTNQQLLAFLNLKKLIVAQTNRVLNNKEFLENYGNPTIYHRLLSISPGKGPAISRRDLFDEALSLLQAGSDTVGNTCTIGTFYILNDQTVHLKLFKELCSVWPDKDTPVGYTVLENLPYLTAVIKESLRVSHGIVTPLPRVVGPKNAAIAGYHVPAGTVVGASATCLHNNDITFPEPQAFSPERWLQQNSRELNRYLVPFSRGPRMCLGVNLAWCELYLIFGNIFRRLDMNIHNTSVEDFSRFKEYFIPIHQGRQFHAFVKKKSF